MSGVRNILSLMQTGVSVAPRRAAAPDATRNRSGFSTTLGRADSALWHGWGSGAEIRAHATSQRQTCSYIKRFARSGRDYHGDASCRETAADAYDTCT